MERTEGMIGRDELHGTMNRISEREGQKGGTAYVIRELREDETGLLREFLYEALFVPEGADPFPRSILDDPHLRIYTDDFGSRDSDHCLVAEADGKVVGAIWARIMDDYGHVDDETPSLSLSLFKEYRGRGIGTQLLAKMLEMLKERGYQKTSLSVQKANYAVRMYRKAGFQVSIDKEEEYIMVCYLQDQG